MSRFIVPLDRWAIILTGSRLWTNGTLIKEQLRKYPVGTIVLHGGAEGADMMGHGIAFELGQVPVAHPYFSEHKRAGGVIRNGLLAKLLDGYRSYGYSTSVEAFKVLDQANVGTSDMCDRANASGFTVFMTWGSLPIGRDP